MIQVITLKKLYNTEEQPEGNFQILPPAEEISHTKVLHVINNNSDSHHHGSFEKEPQI